LRLRSDNNQDSATRGLYVAIRRLAALILYTLTGCAVTVFVVYQYSLRVEPKWVETVSVSVPIRGLPGDLVGFKLALLADIHFRNEDDLDYVRRVMSKTNALEPDLIVIAGDHISVKDYGEPGEAAIELLSTLSELRSPHGTYAVLGNHDRAFLHLSVVKRGLKAAGVNLLVNDGVSLRIGEGTLYLAGVDDAFSGAPDLEEALRSAPPNSTVVLVSHEPDPAEHYSYDRRIKLQLSGHTHGGQVRFPVVGALVLPPLGTKYVWGLFRVGTMWLYVTRGIGVTGPPFGPFVRFNARPEITLITLAKEVASTL